MSYKDMRDFGPEYSQTFADGTTVLIEKVGGGTLGKEYTSEEWRYVVLIMDGVTPYVAAKGEGMWSYGTHMHIAGSVHDYFSEGEL